MSINWLPKALGCAWMSKIVFGVFLKCVLMIYVLGCFGHEFGVLKPGLGSLISHDFL